MDCKYDYNPAQLIQKLPKDLRALIKEQSVNQRRQLIITASCFAYGTDDTFTFCIKPAQGIPGSYEATFLNSTGRGDQVDFEFDQAPNICTREELINFVTSLAADFDPNDYYGDARVYFTSKCCPEHAREYEIRRQYDGNWTAGYPTTFEGKDPAYYYPSDPGSDDVEYDELDDIQEDVGNVVQTAVSKMLEERIDHDFQLDPCSS